MTASLPLLRTVPGACPHDCPDTCAWLADVARVDGQERVVALHGHPDHPHTHGALCTKVARYAERTHHPDRLLTPLKRTGPKGSGQFEPIGWDEALDTIARRLSAIAARDPLAIVPYSYAGTMGLVQGEGMAARFFHRLGASELDRTICASAGGAALGATYGLKAGTPVQDFAHSRLILIWGSNPITSSVHFWTRAQEAKRQGARLICIDPRKSETARRCHQHIALRPGTDGALALGLMHALLEREAAGTPTLDHAYLRDFTAGWPELRTEVQAWSVARAAQVCGVTEAEIRDLAEAWASTRPAAIRLNYGMQRVHGGGNAARLILALPCLTGAWRERGGGLLMSSSGQFPALAPDFSASHLRAGRPTRLINMSVLGDALLHPGGGDFGPRIEALVVYNSNPAAVAPESGRVIAGLSRDDLFTVVLEHFQTDTADYADIVLPATTQLEHDDIHKSYGHTDVLLHRAALAPLGLCRSNAQIFRDIASAMGYTDPELTATDADLVQQAFGDAIDRPTLERQGWITSPHASVAAGPTPFAHGGFGTPSGRAELGARPDLGLDVPTHRDNYESREADPALAARYPLAMISPPERHFMNSTFANVDSLRALVREPRLEMHPEDAAVRGIADGDRVRVFNDRGSYVCRAAVDDHARPGVVHGLGVWWRKQGLAGSNVNELTHQRLTDLGAAATFYDCLVEVSRDTPTD